MDATVKGSSMCRNGVALSVDDLMPQWGRHGGSATCQQLSAVQT